MAMASNHIEDSSEILINPQRHENLGGRGGPFYVYDKELELNITTKMEKGK